MHSLLLRLLPGLAAVTLLAGPARVSAQALQAWHFEEPAATPLTRLVNSVVGGAGFANDVDAIMTDGLGALSICPTVSTISYADIGPYPAGTGIYTLSVKVAGWDLPQGDTHQQTVYIELRNAASTNASLVTELSFVASKDGVNVRYRDSGAANNTVFLTGLPPTRDKPLTLTLTINREKNTIGITSTEGGTTSVVLHEKAISSGSATRAITHCALRTYGNFSTSGFLLESIVFAWVPVTAP